MRFSTLNNTHERAAKLKLLHITLIIATSFVTACASHEGLYEPACVAYEGHRIELRDGRFEWHRFTDQRIIGEDGKIKDPFPGFPKKGRYVLSQKRVQFSSDDGMQLDDLFMVQQGGRSFLLSEEQHEAFLDSKTMPGCALAMKPDAD